MELVEILVKGIGWLKGMVEILDKKNR